MAETPSRAQLLADGYSMEDIAVLEMCSILKSEAKGVRRRATVLVQNAARLEEAVRNRQSKEDTRNARNRDPDRA
jgi:hypothetical protein